MERSQIKRRPLADSVLKTLEPEAKDYRERDSDGLYFRVKTNGTKSWLLRYKRPNGKWAWKGLGGYPAVSGKRAREQAKVLLARSSHGEDLVLDNLEDTPKPMFKDAAEEWYERKVKEGRVKGSLKQYRLYLNKDIYPVIGDKALGEVTRADCAKIQATMEARGAHGIASKVRLWINQIFSLAVGQGKCDLNPASELRHIAEQRPQEKPHPHLREPELPAFLKALRQSESKWVTQVMVRLVLRTACRPGMARFAEWHELDLDNAVWTITSDKMKMRRDHSIPLAPQTVKDLRELQEITGRNRYVFPGLGPKNPTMSENTINKCLRLVGYKGKLVGHGSRHTASTLLREHGWDRDFVEMQLAHVEEGVAGVYNQAEYFDKRREMMNWYADYLDWLEFGGTKPVGPT